MRNTRKTIEVNKNLWVHDYGDETFEVCLRASGPTGIYVYRYEKGRLKYSQRRSYGGASSPKDIEGKPVASTNINEITLIFISAVLGLPLLPFAPVPVHPD